MNEVIINPEQNTAKEDEHNQQMQNLADGVNVDGGQQNQQQGETLLAGKYKTVEDLEKAYKNLESKLGSQGQQNQQSQQTQQNTDQQAQAAKDAAAATGADVSKLDFNAFTKEYNDTGALSEATIKTITDAGIPRDMVDQYIAGATAQKTLNAQTVKELQADIFKSVGGEEKYMDMINWAAQGNISKEEAEAFNSSLTNPAQAKLAVQGLFARYAAENKDLNLILGEDAGAGSGDVYESRAQMIEDMNSDKYKKDPAERRRVMNKLARSNVL